MANSKVSKAGKIGFYQSKSKTAIILDILKPKYPPREPKNVCLLRCLACSMSPANGPVRHIKCLKLLLEMHSDWFL